MKNFYYIVVILVAGLLFYYLFFVTPSHQSNEQLREQIPGTPKIKWESKSDETPPVAITVTPIQLGAGANTWKFEISLDTHSGNLDDDILAVSYLTDDKGSVYKPISWEGAGPGGHHRESALIFDAIVPAPASVELIIKNVGGVPERSFKWNLK